MTKEKTYKFEGDNLRCVEGHRVALTRELLKNCPQDAYLDCCVIADALRLGLSRNYILAMPETKRWPEIAEMLKGQL